MYRWRHDVLEVLLAHPGGPYWAKKDRGVWTIPKGEPQEGETPLQTALREFEEETGHRSSGNLIQLAPVRQSGGKLVYAWAEEGDLDSASLRSNTFSLEWPPHSGKVAEFLEADRFEWFSIDEARSRILKGQVPLLEELIRVVSGGTRE